ncbi:MAG: peptidase dimerization domain-containing protein, partial [Actinobacteria bacterium]|nr:peptidase dimerization domain-containing protein [Actinomycetota bacterium]NIU71822.1 peptidase dimerization domain-containing protein [Actinomycetota bacterium]
GFGDDEETGGLEGGRAIARHLGDRGTTLRLVLDEGGAVVEDLLPGAREAIALLGIGEKGYVNLEVTARAEGGHPSAPPASSAIGLVAEAVRKIEGNPMPPRMAVQHGLLRAIARLMPLPQRMLLRRPRTFGGILAGRLAASPTTNALIRTTMAPTIIEGGVKPNMLPQQARAVVNVRIMPGDTIETVVDHVRSVVGADVAVTAVEEGFRGDPPPVSDPDGDAFRLVAETVGDLFGVGVAPWILTAATDSRHFTD